MFVAPNNLGLDNFLDLSAILEPLGAILDFAGCTAMQAVRRCRLCGLEGYNVLHVVSD